MNTRVTFSDLGEENDPCMHLPFSWVSLYQGNQERGNVRCVIRISRYREMYIIFSFVIRINGIEKYTLYIVVILEYPSIEKCTLYYFVLSENSHTEIIVH